MGVLGSEYFFSLAECIYWFPFVDKLTFYATYLSFILIFNCLFFIRFATTSTTTATKASAQIYNSKKYQEESNKYLRILLNKSQEINLNFSLSIMSISHIHLKIKIIKQVINIKTIKMILLVSVIECLSFVWGSLIYVMGVWGFSLLLLLASVIVGL